MIHARYIFIVHHIYIYGHTPPFPHVFHACSKFCEYRPLSHLVGQGEHIVLTQKLIAATGYFVDQFGVLHDPISLHLHH